MQGQILIWGMKIFRKGRSRGAAPHSVNSGPPHISETIGARNLRFYAHLDGSSGLFGYEFFSARGRVRGTAPLLYIWDLLHI